MQKKRSRTLKNFDLLRKVGIVVFDFDGIFTDGFVYISQTGKEWLRCSKKDGLGIGLLKRTGVKILVLSSEMNGSAIRWRCKKLAIECHIGISD